MTYFTDRIESLLNEGVRDKVYPGAVWAVQTGALEPVRGLFWHPDLGNSLSDDIWGHYGFTGTGMWISPRRRRWAVLLTNKLYYTRDRQPLADVRNAFRGMAFH